MMQYFVLTKPGIIFGNAITAVAGFFLATHSLNIAINFQLLLAMLAGISLVIASGCVFNNYIDRDIDAKMERTKNRALASGLISNRAAIIYGSILGILGFLILGMFTNLTALSFAFTGFFFYVVIYSLWKRLSIYGTIIGSIAGAVPPVVGYTSVSNNFDAGALILFMMLVFWQMPHFYAIGIYRRDEYSAAGIPILPVKKNIFITKINISLFVLAFAIISPMLFFFGYAGYRYFIFALFFGISWFGLCVAGFKKNNNDNLWARRVFIFSLFTLITLSITIALDAI